MTTLPQSRRPDGSLRPAVRVKAGYVPPEEQKKFGREEFKPAAADTGGVHWPLFNGTDRLNMRLGTDVGVESTTTGQKGPLVLPTAGVCDFFDNTVGYQH